jgi:hypothetical protein
VRERLIAEGLPPSPDLSATAALTGALIQILDDSEDPSRASAAAELAEQVFEASLRRHPPRAAIACRKGCSHCCTSNFVAASIPEVLLQARRIREAVSDSGVRLRLRDAARNPRNLADAGKRVPSAPCPVLDGEGACSTYDVRPLACRGYVSTSVEVCIRALSDPAASVPATRTHVFFRSRCAVALFAALKASGLPHASYELGHGLAIAVEMSDAERRWLAGEDVFGAVQVDPTRKPEVEAYLDALIRRATA